MPRDRAVNLPGRVSTAANSAAGRTLNMTIFEKQQAELRKLDRDLSFGPADPAAAKTLTPEQVAFFSENGYLTPFRIFDDDRVDANRRYLDGLLAAVAAAGDGRDTYSICSYQDTCRGLYDLALTPAILDLVEDLVGPDIVCWGTHFFCKLPGDPKQVSWHQDAAYWPLTPSRTVTAWLAIDDVDRENACMQVIPRTHHLGELALTQSEAADKNLFDSSVVDVEQYGDPACIELKAGEISLHSDMLLHASGANLSKRRRGGLTLRYSPTTVRPYLEYGDYSILCRGVDTDGNWANIPRPPGDDPCPRWWQRQGEK